MNPNRLEDIFDSRPRELAPFGLGRPMGADLIYLKSIRTATPAQMELARVLERAAWPRECGPMPEDYFAPDHVAAPLFMQQALALTLDDGLVHNFKAAIAHLESEGVER